MILTSKTQSKNPAFIHFKAFSSIFPLLKHSLPMATLHQFSPLCNFTSRASILTSPTCVYTIPFFSSSKFRPISYNFPKPFKCPTQFIPKADDGDGDEVGPDDYDMDEEEVEEMDNKKDFELDYESSSVATAVLGVADEDITMVDSKSFVSIQGWDSEKIVDYRIDEEEFHKFSLMDCDFFIRKPPDPDNDVYDFREMYVTPPDTDIYAIPRILAPMPEKYIRCAMSDYGRYNVTEPPIDAPRDPMYKTEKDILKIFLTKHYRNRRYGDPEFVLDFEEIYVIDSRTKSITRAQVTVTVPGGRSRDRKSDLLVIRDNGESFKIIHTSERDDPTTVIQREEWNKTRKDMEKHLRKLRDFDVSNWF